eukprot:3101185-Alexandrium_andersonii.AAC.1
MAPRAVPPPSSRPVLAGRHAHPDDGLYGTPPAYPGPHPLDRVYNLLTSLVAPGETVEAARLAAASSAAGISTE